MEYITEMQNKSAIELSGLHQYAGKTIKITG